jgi:hypothetical protein
MYPQIVMGAAAALTVLMIAVPAAAANYLQYVHGKGSNRSALGVTSSSAWGAKNAAKDSYGFVTVSRARASYAHRYVNYNATKDPRSTATDGAQTKLKSAVNTYCKGSNKCVILCHSAGCYATLYYFATNTPAAGILRVIGAGSAAGGSAVANAIVNGATVAPSLINALSTIFGASEPNAMTRALTTSAARSWNHNKSPVPVYLAAGNTHKGTGESGYNLLRPTMTGGGGKHDGIVNFSSACGYNKHGTMTNCDDGSNAKYTNHRVYNLQVGAYKRQGDKAYARNHSDIPTVARDIHDRLLGKL